MTWHEFRHEMDEAGVSDSDEIDYIDVNQARGIDVLVTVVDGIVQVTN